jgi:hypothetical protein
MRELLIASRHRFASMIKSKQPSQQNGRKFFFVYNLWVFIYSIIDLALIQDVKSKQLQETLVHAQEALVIQILLDVLHQYKKV